MREFNLEEAMAGNPVMTKSGKKARVLGSYVSRLSGDSLVVVIDQGDGFNNLYSYPINGVIKDNEEMTLVMTPIKKSGWVLIHNLPSGTVVGAIIYPTRNEAMKHKDNLTISFVSKIEWEE